MMIYLRLVIPAVVALFAVSESAVTTHHQKATPSLADASP